MTNQVKLFEKQKVRICNDNFLPPAKEKRESAKNNE